MRIVDSTCTKSRKIRNYYAVDQQSASFSLDFYIYEANIAFVWALITSLGNTKSDI